jgi:hypothetical protein
LVELAHRPADPFVPVEPEVVVEAPKTDPFWLLLLLAGSGPIEPDAPSWFDDDKLEFASDGLARCCVILPLCKPRLLPPGARASGPVEEHVSLPAAPAVSVPVQFATDPAAHCAAANVAGAAISATANAASSMVLSMLLFPGHQLQLERIAR